MAELTAPSRLTPSNALSALRLAMTPGFVVALDAGDGSIAAALFVAAVASDLIDGRVARARGEVSAFGAFLDHGSDAVFVSAGLFVLARAGLVPVLLPWLVVTAFVQYALDSRVLHGERLRTSRLGRWNGILYFVPVGVVVARLAFDLGWPPDGWLRAAGWALVGSTAISMADRARAFLAHGRR